MTTCVADFLTHPVSVISQESIFWRQSYDTVLIAIFPGDGPLNALAATRCFSGSMARAMQIKGLGRKVKFVFGTKPSRLCHSFLGIDDITGQIKTDCLLRNFRRFVRGPHPDCGLDDEHGWDGMRWAVRLVRALPPPQPLLGLRDPWLDLGGAALGTKSVTDPGADDTEAAFRDAWRAQAVWAAVKAAPESCPPTGAHAESPVYAGAAAWSSTFNAAYRRTWLDVLLTLISVAVAVNSFAWPYYAYLSCWNDLGAGTYAVGSILLRAFCQAYVQRVRFRAAYDASIPDAVVEDCSPVLVAFPPDSDNDECRVADDLFRHPDRYRVPVHVWGLYVTLSKIVIDVDDQDWYATGILVATQLNSFAVLFIVALWRNMAAVIFSLSALTHFTIAVAVNSRMERQRGKHSRDLWFNAALTRANAAYLAAGYCPGPDRWSVTPAEPKYAELVRYLSRRRDSASSVGTANDLRRTSVMRRWLLGYTGSRRGSLRAPLLGP